uniref:Ig-like domain-containing protein n=1 Tax=Oreochromis aureus TaxID=47969 RepID=A0AAZ1X298_OREAU
MLVTLCALITALTCVSGVTVVTQKPVLSVNKGETATMDCNLGTVTDQSARWYKQIPGGVPQHVVRFYHGWSSPRYGSGFSSPKFTSTHQSTSEYRLIINNVEEGDSAVYYCQTWDSSVDEFLIVTSSSLPPPVLTVFPPSSAELQSNTASLVCLSSQSVSFADVSWLAGGSPVSSEISTSTAVQRPDQTYQISSSLTIQTSDWNMDKVYTCKQTGQNQHLKFALQSFWYFFVCMCTCKKILAVNVCYAFILQNVNKKYCK